MIQEYGWSDALQRDFQPYAAEGLTPGRVILQHRGRYRLATPDGERGAELSGRFLHEAQARVGHPVTGDWVACQPPTGDGTAMIQRLLPRRSVFQRRAAGPKVDVQVVAANVETALLVASLNADFNLRRLERYLALAWDSGAQPVVVLTKADLSDDPQPLIAAAEAAALGAPVVAVSAVRGEGLAALAPYLKPRETAVLLGSSGVGKSTLVNALLGTAHMLTRDIREDDARGRHTTTHRELVRLPTGALLLDTPGMRELAMWDADEGVAQAFGDVEAQVEALARGCRFRDCRHRAEPDCAVRAARESGELDDGRWKSWVKLQKELAHEHRKEDPQARAEAMKVWMRISKANRKRKKGAWTD